MPEEFSHHFFKKKRKKERIFLSSYCNVIFEKKIFAETVLVAPIPSVQLTLMVIVGIGFNNPRPIPFGAPRTVNSAPIPRDACVPENSFGLTNKLPAMATSQVTSVAAASPTFFTVTVNPFPPTMLIVNNGLGVSEGECFQIPP